jgi:serine/threonine-protein phosphatase 6 regulatory subunit 3
MSLLNRSADYDYLYDAEGRLQGGLSALEELAQVISMGSEDDIRDNMDEGVDEGVDEVEPALEFPVHGAPQDSSSLLDSDEDMSDDDGPGSFDDDPMEDITASGELKSMDGGSKVKSGGISPSHTRSPADTGASSMSQGEASPQGTTTPGGSKRPRRKGSNQSIGSEGSTIGRRSTGSRRSLNRLTLGDISQSGLAIPVGERLKHKMLDDNVLATILVSEILWDDADHNVIL